MTQSPEMDLETAKPNPPATAKVGISDQLARDFVEEWTSPIVDSPPGPLDFSW